MKNNKPASRDDALDWLVANIDEWPRDTGKNYSSPAGWYWLCMGSSDGSWKLFSNENLFTISKSDWLAAQSRQGPSTIYTDTDAQIAAVKTLSELGYIYVGGEKWITEAEQRRDEAIAAMKQLDIGDYGDPSVIYAAIAAGRIPGVKLEE